MLSLSNLYIQNENILVQNFGKTFMSGRSEACCENEKSILDFILSSLRWEVVGSWEIVGQNQDKVPNISIPLPPPWSGPAPE